ncbi:glycosyltransferase family 9 protein [Mastigocoleus testarum]|uniref:Glycosyltransferase n=1 Tax=Mastigocoleus testarum BC008 TaxID=371196 RepID=A0A0V7ZRR2_9CYAN|nr:glycosyltransferase family 9 protein [Mastigocoleus testarum]KST67328.1 glycosyltransferase [Mastigocoleus testarum BC008]
MRIVALVPGGIGDQLLFFPTLDDLLSKIPQAQIDVVTEPRSKAAYEVSKSVREVIGFDFSDRNSLADWGNLVGTIRDREYDIAITSKQDWFVGLLLWLTGIPQRIGFKGSGSVFLTNSIPMITKQYAASMYHDLLQELGIKSPCPDLSINVPKNDIEWAQREQVRLSVNETGYILIDAGSCPQSSQKFDSRTYPVESWLQIIRDLNMKQPDMPILAVSNPENPEFSLRLKQALPQLKLISPDNIGKLAATIAGANLMLCTHNSSMYLSVAVQTYTIALFGPTKPEEVLPQSDKIIAIESPSGKAADILPKTVLEKILA